MYNAISSAIHVCPGRRGSSRQRRAASINVRCNCGRARAARIYFRPNPPFAPLYTPAIKSLSNNDEKDRNESDVVIRLNGIKEEPGRPERRGGGEGASGGGLTRGDVEVHPKRAGEGIKLLMNLLE